MSSIPKIIFGKCERCGGRGGEYSPTDPSLTTCDAQHTSYEAARQATDGAPTPIVDETGNGWVLKYVDGQLMCEVCEKEFFADIESERMRDRHDQEEFFRAKAGFKKTIT